MDSENLVMRHGPQEHNPFNLHDAMRERSSGLYNVYRPSLKTVLTYIAYCIFAVYAAVVIFCFYLFSLRFI